MNRKRSTLAALAGIALLAAGTAVAGQAPKPAAPAAPAATPAAPAKLAAPIRGAANLGYTKPVTKAERVNGQQFIVTTIQVKNMSAGAIAGLKIDEFWYDAARNPLPGDTFRSRKPIQPNEIITVELRTPRDPKMVNNSYNFSHANGTIVPKLLPKL
jgi:hypothetical protein